MSSPSRNPQPPPTAGLSPFFLRIPSSSAEPGIPWRGWGGGGGAGEAVMVVGFRSPIAALRVQLTLL